MRTFVFWPSQTCAVGPLAPDRRGLAGSGLGWASGLSFGLVLALGLALGSAPMNARAADNSAAAASALKALLGPAIVQQASGGAPFVVPGLDRTAGGVSGLGGAAQAPIMGAAPGAVTTVQRGETLDRVIRRTLPDVPLHLDFLRKAFVSLNPQAFPTGSVHLMRAGSTLNVPSMATLRQMMVQQNPATATLFDAAPHTTGSYSAQDKSRWVRFP